MLSAGQPLAVAVLAGDRRAAGRLITCAEASDPAIEPILRVLYRAGGKARAIGVTGPPGAGKSTIVDRLIGQFRSAGRSVAVLAVDPSSPLSGGAVLGDRVRMHSHAEDAGVLIRSMAARGALGGLSHAAGDAMTILDAMGFDTIIVETVGVGQSEIDILALADIVILLQTAHGGDGIQSVKAGILEVADIIIVNKADAPGTDRMLASLTEMIAHRPPTAEGWNTPVLATVATAGTGITAVVDAMRRHRNRLHTRVLALAEARLRRRVNGQTEPLLLSAIDAVIERRSDPHEAAALLSCPAGGV